MSKNIFDIVLFIAAVATIMAGIVTILQFLWFPAPIFYDFKNDIALTEIVSNDSNLNETLQFGNDATEPEPHDKVAWSKEGDTFKEQGKYIEALQAYKKALKLDSSYLPAMYGEEFTLRKLGYISDADYVLKMANKLAIIRYTSPKS